MTFAVRIFSLSVLVGTIYLSFSSKLFSSCNAISQKNSKTMNALIKKQIIKSSQTRYTELSNWKTKNIFCSQFSLATINLDVITTAIWSSWRLFSIQIVDDSDMSFLK